MLISCTAWVPNENDEIDKTAGVTPVPLNGAVCMDVAPLSVTVSVPVRDPRTVGKKAIEIVQLSLAANVPGDTGQFEVWVKSPEVDIPAMVNGVVRVFLKTIVL